MPFNEFASAARSLSLPVDDSEDDPILPTHTRRSEQGWRRRSPSDPDNLIPTSQTARTKWLQQAEDWQRHGLRMWSRLTPLQKVGLVVLNIALLVLSILFLVYNERIFAALGTMAKGWRDLTGGWLILWALTFVVSFPPLIGFTSCVTMAGFVYGMKGWFIIASATVVGSTCAFILSRTVLRNFVNRLTEKNKRFAALSLVLKHDGLKLLTMIRYCPLPYSLSNGAISTIPTVTWQNFALATAFATPRLLLHVFVGSRLGSLAENGDKMDGKTKAVSYVSIVIGISAGLATGYVVYVRTKARARELEAEEAAAANAMPPPNGGFADDPAEQDAIDVLRRGDDDISLHQAYTDDAEAREYRDEFTDDEDAEEQDVFDIGDGEGEEEENDRGRFGR
ncbi:hypothetical protein BDY17DRAFT_298787 [Neohortaea acidophila]|uniref:Golgi apparatus membrane protein TVP38 n=1 Tax=Neohortaea acidophila TaxID=245834 RepID=A0A6A6PSD6_9PEZI|nr:uncharacterized protein BDY17DRAFT_298787 [Neohortaea acidophila]KAF2482601.1 hypothetical protein BDY17DRAFT_298787 [Neohortaea acidophila]